MIIKPKEGGGAEREGGAGGERKAVSGGRREGYLHKVQYKIVSTVIFPKGEKR